MLGILKVKQFGIKSCTKWRKLNLAQTARATRHDDHDDMWNRRLCAKMPPSRRLYWHVLLTMPSLRQDPSRDRSRRVSAALKTLSRPFGLEMIDRVSCGVLLMYTLNKLKNVAEENGFTALPRRHSRQQSASWVPLRPKEDGWRSKHSHRRLKPRWEWRLLYTANCSWSICFRMKFRCCFMLSARSPRNLFLAFIGIFRAPHRIGSRAGRTALASGLVLEEVGGVPTRQGKGRPDQELTAVIKLFSIELFP